MNRMHPFSFFLCITASSVAAALTADPAILITALVLGALTAALAGVRSFWPYALMIFAVTLINPFFSHRGNTILFFLNDTPFTLEAVLAGLDGGLKLGAVMLMFAAYSRVMTTDKHLCLFAAFTPRLGLTLSSALRFAPLFVRRCREISMAQRAMGLYSSAALWDSLRGRLTSFSAAFGWALENGVTTAMSMRARGYGSGRRVGYSLFRFTLSDMVVTVLALLSAAVLIATVGEVRFVFYPEPSPLSAAVLPRAAFALLCALPAAMEIKEKLQWKFSVSRISALPTAELKDLF